MDIFHLCIVLSVLRSVSSQTDSGMVLNLVCRAKCLEIFKTVTSSSENYGGNKKPFLIESFCLNDPKCKGCSSACSWQGSSLEGCKGSCKTLVDKSSQAACIQSCGFVESRKVNRPGVCPSKAYKTKCLEPCQKDLDCFKQGTKCCKSALCGNMCQIATLPTENVPPIPPSPLVRQVIDKGDRDQVNFDLDWSSYDIHSVDYPVLFLVQVMVGAFIKNKTVIGGSWRDLISTTKSGVIISSIYPENWFQFRLVAFSKHGYKDFGKATTPITVKYKPMNPMPPRNVTEKVSRIVNKHISVTLSWQPGISNNLVPLSNYKVSWRRFHENYEPSLLMPEYEIIIPATETSYSIQDLKPTTTYKIQIVAVVIYKGATYNSTATVFYVTTSSLPNYIPSQKESPLEINKYKDCACGSSNKELPVVMHNSTIINGQVSTLVTLKDGVKFDSTFAPYSFLIHWYPRACIESDSLRMVSDLFDLQQSMVVNNFINHYMTGLRMQCSYRIEVELFSQLAKKTIQIWDGCFCTPNCNIDKVKIENASICPQTDQHVPPAPNNLRVLRMQSANGSTPYAELRWDCGPSAMITGYRITWGPRLEEPINDSMYSKELLPLLDYTKAISRVVKHPGQMLILQNLDLEKVYLVKVQSMNKQLSSQDSVLFFKVHFDGSSCGRPTVVANLCLFSMILTHVMVLL